MSRLAFLSVKANGRRHRHEAHPLTLHFLLLSTKPNSTKALGALRVFPIPPPPIGEAYQGKTYRLGRLAVPKSERGKGYGRVMMEGIHEYFQGLAKKTEPVEVVLHSQLPKVGFYTKFGYSKQGDEFLEDGQPHLMMTKTIY